MQKLSVASLLMLLVLFGGCMNRHDVEAARTVADRIHNQMGNVDFASVYRESSAGFKTISEAEFVAQLTDINRKLGARKDIQQRAYQTGVETAAGRTYTLIFDINYENDRVRETLVFVRGEKGAMQLWKLGIVPIK